MLIASMSQPSRARAALLVRAVAACVSLGAFATAGAEPNPYYLGAGVTFGHDSNIARAPKSVGDKYSDSYSELFLLAGLNQPIGRQRLYVDGRVGRTKYNDLSRFDNTGYNLRAGVEWEALDRLKGDLHYFTNRNRATDAGGTNNDEKNLETTQEFLFRAQYGLVSLLSLEGELLHRQLDYSNSAFQTNEVKQDAVKLGVIYRPSGLLTLGTGLRHTRGDYVNRADGGFDRNDLEFTARWEATGQSTLEALIAIGRENQDDPAANDVSGTTGYVRWLYKPTGKLNFTTQLSRERGRDSAFLATGATGGQVGGQIGDQNQSRVSTALSIAGLWEATAKIGVTADAAYTKRDLSNTGLSTGDGSDRTKILALGIRYEITRNIEASCKVGRESRSTSGTITNPYAANFASCSAQVVLR